MIRRITMLMLLTCFNITVAAPKKNINNDVKISRELVEQALKLNSSYLNRSQKKDNAEIKKALKKIQVLYDGVAPLITSRKQGSLMLDLAKIEQLSSQKIWDLETNDLNELTKAVFEALWLGAPIADIINIILPLLTLDGATRTQVNLWFSAWINFLEQHPELFKSNQDDVFNKIVKRTDLNLRFPDLKQTPPPSNIMFLLYYFYYPLLAEGSIHKAAPFYALITGNKNTEQRLRDFAKTISKSPPHQDPTFILESQIGALMRLIAVPDAVFDHFGH